MLACTVFARNEFYFIWFSAMTLLGNARFERIENDHVQSWVRVIDCFGKALRVRVSDADLAGWATLQVNMRLFYGKISCIEISHGNNTEIAILCFEKALSFFTQTE